MGKEHFYFQSADSTFLACGRTLAQDITFLSHYYMNVTILFLGSIHLRAGSMAEPSVAAETAARACAACHKNKRRCDKILPTCSLCKR